MDRRQFLMSAGALACAGASAQNVQENYDESKVGKYTLPDPLVLQNGDRVRNADTWIKRRRPEILHMYETEMYGRTPEKRIRTRVEMNSTAPDALNGKAVRKQLTIYFSDKNDGPKMRLLLYVPADARKPVPAFLALNFGGNHAVHADPGIALGEVWLREPGASKPPVYVKQLAKEDSRGSAASRWDIEKILARGYALATANYQDIEPDFVGGMQYGVRPLFFNAGQTEPAASDWGALGAWAWGLSRAVDYLETDKSIDATKIAVMGHSRIGKATLWGGAQDPRFAIVISNDSGEGGAALSRRNYGETVERLNTAFPHWFCANYKKYSNHEDRLPMDQHMLLALMAPRPVYVASAEEDRHSDPRGEFLAAVNAGPVYELLGKKGLGTDQMPAIHQPIMNTIGYHIRAGKHDVTAYDWDQYLAFADKHFGRPRQ
jgi:hypothetical protein